MSEIVTIGNATLYLGDCRDILPTLPKVDLVLTDPPYGFLAGSSGRGAGKLKFRALNVADIQWDNEPPAMETLSTCLEAGFDAVIWGGNYFSLPPSRGILVWDKRQPWPNFSAAEIAWTTFKRPCAMFRLSSSLGYKGIGNDHPTVKPLELIEWCLSLAPKTTSTVVDPFMGSGTTGVACANMGKTFYGIERERKYFDIACERIERAYAQQRLFV
jgi:site-specific DNA-methyltransferase (adenine-specific)